jgi:hypothetical protein
MPVRHPENVSHLVLLGGYARGIENRELPASVRAEFEALVQLVQAGWGREDATYRQMFAMQFHPGRRLEEIKAMGELQRAASSATNATRLLRSFYAIDVRDEATRVRCPTLVMHATSDRRIPFEEGRLMAGLIPGARFVPLDSTTTSCCRTSPRTGNSSRNWMHSCRPRRVPAATRSSARSRRARPRSSGASRAAQQWPHRGGARRVREDGSQQRDADIRQAGGRHPRRGDRARAGSRHRQG